MISKPLYLVVTTLALAGGCGGTLPTPSIPSGEAEMVGLLPDDAFAAVRFDGRAVRALPTWPRAAAILESRDADLLAIAQGIDVAYVAVGSMVEVPPVPPPYAEDGTPNAQPHYAEIAARLDGRVPTVVVAMTGSVTRLCRNAVERETPTHVAGFDVMTHAGAAVAVRGDLCVYTPEPMMERVLADHSGMAPVVADLLRRRPAASTSLVGVGVDFEATSFQDLLSTVDAIDPEANGGFDATFLRFLSIHRRGIDRVTWDLDAGAGHYASAFRVHATDRDRGVMHRELGEILLESMVASLEIMSPREGEAERQRVLELLRTVVIAPTRDGFEVTADVDETTVASVVESITHEAARPIEVPDTDDTSFAYDIGGSPSEVIAAIGPHRAELPHVAFEQRQLARLALARALSARGRYDEARTVVEDVLADPGPANDYERSLSQVATEAHGARCEIELTFGDASAARDAADRAIAACAGSCGVSLERATVCRGAALGMAGDVQGLAAVRAAFVDAQGEEDDMLPLAISYVRGLEAAGRDADALAFADLVCGNSRGPDLCTALSIDRCEIAARTSSNADEIETACTRAAEVWTDDGVDRAVARARAELARCEASFRVAPDTSDGLCTAARETVDTVSGEKSALIVRAELALAQAIRRADPEGAAAATERAESARARLAPTHPARRSTAGRPRRPRH